MKTKKEIASMQLKKERTMIKLIRRAMDRYEPEDLLEMMYKECCSVPQMDYLREKMRDMVCIEDGMFIKTVGLGLDKTGKLVDFINTEIYPCYNEQTANIFSY